MASNVSSQQTVASLALAVFGVRLGAPSLAAVSTEVERQGAGTFFNAVYAQFLGSLSTAQVAARVVDNVGLAGGLREQALLELERALAAAPAAQRGATLVAALEYFMAQVVSPVYGNAAAAFVAEVNTGVQSPGSADVYLRPAAAAAQYAPWIASPPPPPPPPPAPPPPPPPPAPSPTLLDLKSLSDSIAASVGSDPMPDEGLYVKLALVPETFYRVDANNDGLLLDSEKTTIVATYGVDDLRTGAANDFVTLTQQQLRTSASHDLGGQQDNTKAGFLREGADKLTIDHSDIDRNGVVDAVDAPLRPNLALAVQAAGKATIDFEGGALYGRTARHVVEGVEILDVSAAATSNRFVDSLSVAALGGGATINFGLPILVGTSLGGKAAADTVARIDGNQLDTGGIAAAGALGTELMTVLGLTKLERVVGSAGDDRVILADTMAASGAAAAKLPPTSYLGAANTVAAVDVATNRFDLAGGSGDMLDYRQEVGNVAVVVDFANGSDHVVVDGDFDGVLTTAGFDRVDLATGVERYFASMAIARIDLSAATQGSTTRFSAESQATGSEFFDPNGRAAVPVANQVRGIAVTAADGTLLARFMDADAGDTTSSPAARWDEVVGSAFGETVFLTSLEDATPQSLKLGGGANSVSYGILGAVAEITATVAAGSQTYTVVPLGGATDTITITRSVNAGTLSLTATSRTEDTITHTFGAPTKLTGDAAALKDLSGTAGFGHHLVDLQAGRIVEDARLTAIAGPYSGAGYADIATPIFAFENAGASAQQDRLYGNDLPNRFDGGGGNDILIGRGGADTLTGGAGNDRIGYGAVADGGSFGTLSAASADSLGDFDASGDDVLVIDTTLFAALFQKSGSTIVADAVAVATNGANLDTANVFLVTAAVASNSDLENAAAVAAKIGTLAGTAVGDGRFFGAAGSNDATQQALFVVGAGAGGRAGVYAFRDGDDNNTISAGELRLVALVAGQGVVAAGADAAGEFRAADVVVRVPGMAGQQTLDLDNGTASSTELVYASQNDSRIGFVDVVLGFSGATDRIDVSGLFAGRTLEQSAVAGLRSTATAIVHTDAAANGFFVDSGGKQRTVVVEELTSGTSTRVFVDVNLDGNFDGATDLVIGFAGVGLGIVADTFIYG